MSQLGGWIAAGIVGSNGEPGDWVEDALCPETDPDMFFPERGGGAKVAQRVCVRCDVQPECLLYALVTGQEHGVWGGTSETERRGMTVPPAPVAPVPTSLLLPPRNEREARDRQLLRLRALGLSAREIGEQMGVTDRAVQRRLAQLCGEDLAAAA